MDQWSYGSGFWRNNSGRSCCSRTHCSHNSGSSGGSDSGGCRFHHPRRVQAESVEPSFRQAGRQAGRQAAVAASRDNKRRNALAAAPNDFPAAGQPPGPTASQPAEWCAARQSQEEEDDDDEFTIARRRLPTATATAPRTENY